MEELNNDHLISLELPNVLLLSVYPAVESDSVVRHCRLHSMPYTYIQSEPHSVPMARARVDNDCRTANDDLP